MTAPYRKKRIEVSLPLEAIEKTSAKEQSIRHGHPKALDIWWAWWPLAACRAVLLASLVADSEGDRSHETYRMLTLTTPFRLPFRTTIFMAHRSSNSSRCQATPDERCPGTCGRRQR